MFISVGLPGSLPRGSANGRSAPGNDKQKNVFIVYFHPGRFTWVPLAEKRKTAPHALGRANLVT
jgi:hypothetical protein